MEKDLLTIGEMAERNCISKKTLLLYQEMDLLVPATVDERNGRRYYRFDQSYRLDFIQRLQAVGLSLAEIRDIIQAQGYGGLENSLQTRVDSIAKQQSVLASSKAMIDSMLAGMQAHSSFEPAPRAFPPVRIEDVPAFGVWKFSFDDLGIPTSSQERHPCSEEWHKLQAATKRRIQDRIDELGLSLPTAIAFRKIACTYSRESYLQGSSKRDSVLCITDTTLADIVPDIKIQPASTCLTISCECLSLLPLCEGGCVALAADKKLFEFAEKHNFKTADTCYIEPADDLIALYEGKLETLFRARLQVLEE